MPDGNALAQAIAELSYEQIETIKAGVKSFARARTQERRKKKMQEISAANQPLI